MNNALNSLYLKKKPATTSTDPAISIDISSDEEEGNSNSNNPNAANNKQPPTKLPTFDSTKLTVSKLSANGSKIPATTEELASLINSRPGPASTKRRRLEEIESIGSKLAQREKDKLSTNPSGASQRPKKFKKEVNAKRSTVKFADVGGMSKTLEEICELTLHMKHPNIYRTIGSTPPRGILLHGPPGEEEI